MRFVAGSLARGLSSRGGGGYMLTTEMMARPGSMQGVMMNKQQSQQYYYWRSRMMSSVAEKSKEGDIVLVECSSQSHPGRARPEQACPG
nr:hypothetical protein CFP56_68561 [Quercus suber]